ncbi:hypothetical protein EUTSA_v10011097mg [Eutrema salsugineum]|uniref:Uncharacterized protein n=2 Tax=Eutrema salsugineum TaxID=72664 RepID=V4LNB0_EUTSA|nr:hypothetical protein EUTSA_v10011097mg [Eutrema salsugineum]
MRNKNGKRLRVEPPARTTEPVVANRRFRGGSSSSSDTSSTINSCLSTMEETKEEVASSWVEESPALVAVGCRRCKMYFLVRQDRQRCLKCKCYDVIKF